MAVPVNVDNFRAAETARMFGDFIALAGGVNRWAHFRAPTPVESQPVIRMNRDTLYSTAVVDIRQGATLTVPDTGGRYLSVMAVNGEHYVNRVFSAPGPYQIDLAEHETPFVALAARIFVDPADVADVAAVNALQDQLHVDAAGTGPYEPPDYDKDSLDQTRDALLVLGRGLGNTDRFFGRKDDVDPTRHLIGTAMGWGGLPEAEAYYYVESDPREVGHYTLTLADVPVDAFWSFTIYNRDGYLEPNDADTYSINSVTAVPEADGSVVVHLAPDDTGIRNHLFVMDGWNYALRLYRPRPEILDKRWAPPTPVPVEAAGDAGSS